MFQPLGCQVPLLNDYSVARADWKTVLNLLYLQEPVVFQSNFLLLQCGLGISLFLDGLEFRKSLVYCSYQKDLFQHACFIAVKAHQGSAVSFSIPSRKLKYKLPCTVKISHIMKESLFLSKHICYQWHMSLNQPRLTEIFFMNSPGQLIRAQLLNQQNRLYPLNHHCCHQRC